MKTYDDFDVINSLLTCIFKIISITLYRSINLGT